MTQINDLNHSWPWSELDLRFLSREIQAGMTIEQVARFFSWSKTTAEVARKAKELGLEVRHDKPLRVNVACTDGHWFADMPNVGEPIDSGTLAGLIKAVQRSRGDEVLTFVVDRSTIDGDEDAEWQFLQASGKSGALVISSAH
jgi:hypothetical protein